MDRACEDDVARQLAADLGFRPVVPPKSSRIAPWGCDRKAYRRLKGFRRVFSRYDRVDVIFLGFIVFALVVDALRSVNMP